MQVMTGTKLAAAERTFAELTTALADLTARRRQIEANVRSHRERVARLDQEIAQVDAGIAQLAAETSGFGDLDVLAGAVESAQDLLGQSEYTVQEAEATLAATRQTLEASRAPLAEADKRVQRLETEGFISAYVALVDARKIGKHTTVFVEITLNGQSDEVLDAIRECIPLAPLHNPANLTGIEVALQAFPDCPHVAVFDTAFHQTMPPASYRYAIDREVAAAHRIRRYGFHGTSHAFVSRRAAEFLDIPLDTSRIITLHLGNGASACAIRNGASIDTSMGLTPLAGLVMGTRSGDIDPGALLHLLREGMSVEDVDSLLNKRSGMKGLTGDNDLRQVHAAAATGDAHAVEALEVYVHAIRHYVGAYLAELGGADALVFTAGVGENDAAVREAVCAGLAPLGIAIDAGKNASTRGPNEVVNLTARGAPVQVLVVPTNEELEIATQSLASVRSSAIE